MTFENFAKLTNAKLLNKPFISSYERIVFDSSKVKRGDLFVGNDPKEIKTAISRDAYAILSDQKVNILDDEIAWLKCPNIEDSLTALLRYDLMNRNLHFVYFDKISAALMKHIVSKEEIIFLSQDAKQNFQNLYTISDNTIVISSDKKYLQNIYPKYETPDIAIYQKLEITKSTLFQSSFTYHKSFYENIKIPELFINNLEYILNYLDTKLLYYDIYKCNYIKEFYPICINKQLQIKPFGTTSLVLVVTQSNKNLKAIQNYLKEKASWAKILYFIPQENKKECLYLENLYTYKTITQIKRLKELEFNFAIINANLHEVVNILQNLDTKEQLSLF